MQHLERDLTLQMQVPHPIDPAEPAGAQQAEQLVVVAQGAAEPLFPPRACPRRRPGGPGDRHRPGLERAGLRGESPPASQPAVR